MIRKAITVITAAALTFALASPAFASNTLALSKGSASGFSSTTSGSTSTSDALAKVTESVKQTLGIDDTWTGFNGELSDRETGSFWNLSWSGDGCSMDVTADENGKVFSYHLNKDSDNDYYSSKYAPSFPKASRDDAMKVAKDFITKVLGKNETITFSTSDQYNQTSNVIYFWFDGTININGLKTPINFNVSVNISDLSVRNFSRSDLDGNIQGDIPSATPAVTADKAASLLKSKVQLCLRYSLSDDGKSASLRYTPVHQDESAVNAQTGEFVDFTKPGYEAYSNAASSTDLVAGKGESSAALSPVEQASIDKMKDVLSKDKLDAAARAYQQLGLTGDFKLQNANYSMDPTTGNVTSNLQYSRKISNMSEISSRFPQDYSNFVNHGSGFITIYKNLTMDAKTGALKEVYTYNSGSKESTQQTASSLQANAEAFLKACSPDNFSKCAFNKESSAPDKGSFEYSQSVNAILFLQNSLWVTMDAYDGTVNSYNVSWKDGINFDSADGIIKADAALAAYNGCFKASLEYIGVPLSSNSSISDTSIRPNSACNLLLAYRYESDKTVSSIDAKTGKVIYAPEISKAKTYDDISGCYGEAQITKLASFGIGFDGTSFKPAQQLTQKDALKLLLSASGMTISDDDNTLYQQAYNCRFLKKADKDPDKLLTRLGYVKMLIGATDYGSSAALSGIYSTGFGDEDAITASDKGYVAIAKALGVVHGDENGCFNPDGLMTRQDAAIILYNFMSR